MKKNICVILVFILIVLNFIFCDSSRNKYYEKSNIVMDMVVILSVYGENFKEVVEESFKKLDEINEMVSINIDISDIYKINNLLGESYV